MALVSVTNVLVLDNPTAFANPFAFEITFECIQVGASRIGECFPQLALVDRRVIGSRARRVRSVSQELEDDLEWKLIYVGSADDEEMDQTLEEVMDGPVPVGVNKFVFHSPAPEAHTISEDVLVGVTVILITCSYRDMEFVRVGYYVNNEYFHNPPVLPGPGAPPLPPPVDAEARAAQAAAQAQAMPPPAPTAEQLAAAGGDAAAAHAAAAEAYVRAAADAARAQAQAENAAARPQPVDPEQVPRPVDVTRLYRNILADRPRVTRFPIDWGTADATAPPDANGGSPAAMATSPEAAKPGAHEGGVAVAHDAATILAVQRATAENLPLGPGEWQAGDLS